MRFTFAVVLYLLSSLSVLAQSQLTFSDVNIGDSGMLEVNASSLTVDQGTNSAQFSGDVVIEQGTLRLKAQSVAVYYSEGQRDILRFEARQSVIFQVGQDQARAKAATYDVAQKTLKLSGGVQIQQGGFRVQADFARVNLVTGHVVLDGNVRTRLP